MANIGDTIRYLNSTGGGIIRRIDGQTAYVEETDGFETPVLLRECVVVLAQGDERARQAADTVKTRRESPEKEKEAEKRPAAGAFKLVNSPLNLTLAYDPREVKHLNTTTFDTYLINDSEYSLLLAYMTRADKDSGWVTRWTGVVEAGMQEWLGEFTGADLNSMARIAVQYVAFVPAGNTEFALKAPMAMETRLDLTKFYKLHCFRDSVYFDTPVMEIELVKNDVPRRQISFQSLPEDLGQKDREPERPRSRPVSRRETARKKDEPIVVDLHAGELLDTTAGMSNSDILNLQIDTFRRAMDQNLRNHGQKIVFIHGKGEGVLRAALVKELGHRYKGHDVQDASFREYGYGATQVTIK